MCYALCRGCSRRVQLIALNEVKVSVGLQWSGGKRGRRGGDGFLHDIVALTRMSFSCWIMYQWERFADLRNLTRVSAAT